MKRAFSTLFSGLRKSENDELKSTIQFLVDGSRRPSLSFLLDYKANTNTAQNHHVERVLRILNASLPEVESQKRRVQSHYAILFSQLKGIARQSSQQSSTVIDNSKKSYNYLLLQQYMGNLNSVPKMAKIVLSRSFQGFEEVWENFAMFDTKQQLHLSVLLYYRSHNSLIRQKFQDRWLDEYTDMHISIQRLLWRCFTRECRRDFELENVIHAVQARMSNWSARDTIVLYQSLYTKCHLLPFSRDLLTKNQQLFIVTLRTLANHSVYKGHMLKIVKLSIENRLANESAGDTSTISIYQYRFIRALDLAVRDAYSSTVGYKGSCKQLQNELHGILESINDEEQDVRSQMSLKFI